MTKKPKVRAIHPKVSPEEREKVFDYCYNIMESSRKKPKRDLKVEIKFCDETVDFVEFFQWVLDYKAKKRLKDKK